MPGARAIEISSVAFVQCPTRTCTVPFNLEVRIVASGAPPFSGYFYWGDNVNTTVTVNNGTSSTFDVVHRYTVKGNYSLLVTIVSNDSAGWSSIYNVVAVQGISWIPTAALTVAMEGQGYVNQLYRQKGDFETFTAFVHNTGYAAVLPVTVTFYGGSWANPCGSWSIGALDVGAWGYATTNPAVATACESKTPVFAKATSSTYPSLNASSPAMIVNWSNTVPGASVSVRISLNTISAPTGGWAPHVSYFVKNTGSFSLDWYDTPTQSVTGAFLLIPNDLGNPYDFLTVYDGATAYGFLQRFGERQVPGQNGPNPFVGVGRIVLQPGQEIEIDRSFQALGTPSASGTSLTIQDPLSPKCLAQGSPPDYTYACGASVGAPIGATATVNAVISNTGASIIMASVLNLANGTSQFFGQVFSIAPGSGTLSTKFIFWKTALPGTTYFVNAAPLSSPGTVSATVTGLASVTNYSVQFAVQGTGPPIYSNILNWQTSAGCSGPACGTAGGAGSGTQSFTNAFLFWMSQAAGIPAPVIGFVIGMAFMGFVLIAVLLMLSKFEIDPPPELFVGVILTVLIFNVVLFLWPDWVLAIVIVAEALALWNRYSSSGAGVGG